MKRRSLVWIVIIACLISAYPARGAEAATVLGYVGPGAGLGALGALVAVLAAVLLGIVGLALYPIQLVRHWLEGKHGSPRKESNSNPETTT